MRDPAAEAVSLDHGDVAEIVRASVSGQSVAGVSATRSWISSMPGRVVRIALTVQGPGGSGGTRAGSGSGRRTVA